MTRFVTIPVDAVPDKVTINLEHVKMMLANQSGSWIEFVDGKTVESTMRPSEILALSDL